MIDFPGHARLRGELATCLAQAKVIVFLIDSTDLSQSESTLAEVSELLYETFLQAVRLEIEPKMLIACNKMDLPHAIQSVDDIKERISKQL